MHTRVNCSHGQPLDFIVAEQQLEEILIQRWTEAKETLSGMLEHVNVLWGVGDSILFESQRCFASATFDGSSSTIRFSRRLLPAAVCRVDGVVRHEIGHVVDMNIPWPSLDAWAEQRFAELPHTPERRADAIAKLLWGSPIYYDESTVQTTAVTPVDLRPEHLGL